MAIESVTDFITKCFSYENRGKNSGRRHILFFRGEHEEYKELLPSIYQPQYDINYEDTIFKEIIAAFPEEMLAQKTTIEKLILMQHFEFPTRILDMSRNPLVGLFFSCYREIKKEKEKDGRVYVFSVPEEDIKYCDSDTVAAISNICKRPASFSIKDIVRLDRDVFNDEEEIRYLVHEIREEKPYYQNLIEPKDLSSVVCLHPRMNNPRIIRQDGYFFVFGIDGDKKNCAKINPDWIVDKIQIPGEAKAAIMKELDRLNINESFLFPDYRHLKNVILERYGKK
jgi:hypothetical protein